LLFGNKKQGAGKETKRKVSTFAKGIHDPMIEHSAAIPLMKPCLPDRKALEPYLDEIDKNRWYTNNGPLERRFEERLAKTFGVEAHQIICVSNGTQALSISLRTVARSPAGCCLMPSFTFAATPHAAVVAGLAPYFLDVEPDSWALDPQAIKSLLPSIELPISAIVPVAPFGSSIDIDAWDVFHYETGIPVVIDAAAGFDHARPGNSPVIISLHATKAMGIGEGGFVLCGDDRIADEIRAGRNFGFINQRVSEIPGTNAKLSEFGAAVGLAALDIWPSTRVRLCDLAGHFVDLFAGLDCLSFAPGFSVHNAITTCNVAFKEPLASSVIYELGQTGVEARRWWNYGCHKEPVFSGCAKGNLDVTEYLTERVVGLPYFLDLDLKQIKRIRDAVIYAVER